MVYGLGGGTFHMSSAAWEDEERREASIKLLRFLTSPESAAQFASRTGMISNVSLEGYDIDYIDMTIKGMRMLEEADTLVGPLDSFVDRTVWEKYIAEQFPYFLSGKITAEEMWEAAIENGIVLDY
ncbi:MAG TPA: ABC transporter substrate-binding protein, partial [Clostridiales bacterium]|nr:ABC transporter substrate-binding protein [Clostridiales bacterium]